MGFWGGFPQLLVSCFKGWTYRSEFQLINRMISGKQLVFAAHPVPSVLCDRPNWSQSSPRMAPICLVSRPIEKTQGVDRRMRLLGVLVLSIALLLVSSLLIGRSNGEQPGFFQHIQDMRIRSGE